MGGNRHGSFMRLGSCAKCGAARYAYHPDMTQATRPFSAENWIWTCETSEHRREYLAYIGRSRRGEIANPHRPGDIRTACVMCGRKLADGNRSCCSKKCRGNAHTLISALTWFGAPQAYPRCRRCGGSCVEYARRLGAAIAHVEYCGPECLAAHREDAKDLGQVIKLVNAAWPPPRMIDVCGYEQCAQPFVRRWRVQKFCCDKCRMKAHRGRKIEQMATPV